MATTPKLLSKDEGLLAFIYKVYTDRPTADAFKADPWTTMDNFVLTSDEQRAIWSLGLDRDAPENEAALAAIRTGGLPARGPAANPVGDLKDVKWGYAGRRARSPRG